MTETREYTESEQSTIARVEADLLSGRYFHLIANGNRSVHGYASAIAARGYGGILQALGRYAAQGDREVAAVSKIHVNPYGTTNEAIAQVASGLAKVASEGYYDVIGATGPEASRPSAHQHKTTLRVALGMALLMTEVKMVAGFSGSVPNIGWCLDALLKRENYPIYPMTYPHVAEYVKARDEG